MFAAVRRGKAKPGMAEEFVKRVKNNALPELKKIAGYKGYYLVVAADGTITAVTLFASKAGAEESNTKLRPWIMENLAPLLAGPPELGDGEVLVSDP